MLIPLSPIYLTTLPKDKKDYYNENFDKFGDSYSAYLNRRELDEILKSMETSKIEYPIDKRLMERICLKKRRSGKVSFCIGIDDMEQLKLRLHGN